MVSPLRVLSWDSRHFGRRIAQVNASPLRPNDVVALLTESRRKGIDCLYYLVPASDSSSMACAETAGFHLVDVRMTLTQSLHRQTLERPLERPGVRFRPARSADLTALQPMAQRLFTDSRFACDPQFPKDASRRLYSQWLVNALRGKFDDWLGVAEAGGRPIGFVSTRQTGKTSGAIGLLGVDRRYSSRGVGQGLLRMAHDWFGRRGIRTVDVVTQGRAVRAQRFYQAAGYRTTRVDLWYHKWL